MEPCPPAKKNPNPRILRPQIPTKTQVGRRFKITNPDKMRSTYGKLIYILQDSPATLDFSVHQPVKTVYSFLKAKDGLALLEDEHLGAATLSASVGRGKGADSRGALDTVRPSP